MKTEPTESEGARENTDSAYNPIANDVVKTRLSEFHAKIFSSMIGWFFHF